MTLSSRVSYWDCFSADYCVFNSYCEKNARCLESIQTYDDNVPHFLRNKPTFCVKHCVFIECLQLLMKSYQLTFHSWSKVFGQYKARHQMACKRCNCTASVMRMCHHVSVWIGSCTCCHHVTLNIIQLDSIIAVFHSSTSTNHPCTCWCHWRRWVVCNSDCTQRVHCNSDIPDNGVDNDVTASCANAKPQHEST